MGSVIEVCLSLLCNFDVLVRFASLCCRDGRTDTFREYPPSQTSEDNNLQGEFMSNKCMHKLMRRQMSHPKGNIQ